MSCVHVRPKMEAGALGAVLNFLARRIFEIFPKVGHGGNLCRSLRFLIICLAEVIHLDMKEGGEE